MLTTSFSLTTIPIFLSRIYSLAPSSLLCETTQDYQASLHFHSIQPSKMKFSITAAALALAGSVAAEPIHSYHRGGYHGYSGCLSQDKANQIVAEYAAIQAQVPSDLGSAKRTAQRLLAPGFTETSDSLNELIGIPVSLFLQFRFTTSANGAQQLGVTTFTDKKSYIQAVLTTTPAVIDTIRILVSGCNYITWQWSDSSAGSNVIKGFHLFETNNEGQITQAWLEFNSIAWYEDLGGNCAPAPAAAVSSAVPSPSSTPA